MLDEPNGLEPVLRRAEPPSGLEPSLQTSLAFQVHPADEAVRVPDLLVFRNTLLKAIEVRDFGTFRNSLAKDVVNGWNQDPDGPNALIQAYRDDPYYWERLEEALRWGGGFDEDGTFLAPNVWPHWPVGVHPLEFPLIVWDGALPLYPSSSLDSRPTDLLSYDIVRVVAPDGDAFEIETPDGRRGFVPAHAQFFVHGEIEVGIRRKKGAWEVAWICGTYTL